MYNLCFILFILFGTYFHFQENKAFTFTKVSSTYNLFVREKFNLNEINDTSRVFDLLPLKDGSLIAVVDRGTGLIMSKDGGQSWSQFGDDSIYFKQLIIDNNNIMWGLDYNDYAYLFKSADKGKKWSLFKFDISKMFPIKIISGNYEPLKIVTVNKNIYELKGNNLTRDWCLIGKDDSTIFLEGLISGNFLVKNETVYKKKLVTGYDSLYHIKDFEALDILAKEDTLFISGYEDHITTSFFASFANKELKKIEMKGAYLLRGIREDASGRIWVFGENGIYLYKNGKLIRKY